MTNPHYRNVKIEILGFDIRNIDIYMNFPFIETFTTQMKEIGMINVNIQNCHSLGAQLRIVFSRLIHMENFMISDISNTIGHPINIFMAFKTKLINTKLQNYSAAPNTILPPIWLNIPPTGFVKIDSLQCDNCIINTFPLLLLIGTPSLIEISNFHFQNTHLVSGVNLISFNYVQSLSITNQTLMNVTTDTEDTLSTFINFKVVNIELSEFVIIDSINFVNSSVSFLNLDFFEGTISESKSVNISNIKYTDSYFPSSRSLISTEGLQYTGNLEF